MSKLKEYHEHVTETLTTLIESCQEEQKRFKEEIITNVEKEHFDGVSVLSEGWLTMKTEELTLDVVKEDFEEKYEELQEPKDAKSVAKRVRMVTNHFPSHGNKYCDVEYSDGSEIRMPGVLFGDISGQRHKITVERFDEES